MNRASHSGVVSIVLILACFLAASLSDAWGQETKPAEPPRDTLIAVARALMDQARFCALITLDESGHPRARAMQPFAPTEGMGVWMGTDRKTRKVADIRKDPRVTLYYAHPQGAGYVSLSGTARLVDDPKEKARWWNEEWERFYPEDRSGYILIAVTPKRLEVFDFTRGVTGDPETWRPASVEF